MVKSSDNKHSELAHAEQEAARVQAAEDDKCRKWMKEIDRVRDQQVVATMVYHKTRISKSVVNLLVVFYINPFSSGTRVQPRLQTVFAQLLEYLKITKSSILSISYVKIGLSHGPVRHYTGFTATGIMRVELSTIATPHL